MRRDAFAKAGVLASERLRGVDLRHLRLYAGWAVAVAILVAYLALAAQVTQVSYELARLQNQQAALQAEQGQLRLREADLHTPAQVEQDAQAAGLQRQAPRGYATYQGTGVDLAAPIGQPAPVDRPLWQDAVASLLGAVGGSRDVLAGDR